MLWVFIFGGIALAGLLMVIGYAVWLVHKASDLWSEVVVMTERLGSLADVLAGVRVPDFGGAPLPPGSSGSSASSPARRPAARAVDRPGPGVRSG